MVETWRPQPGIGGLMLSFGVLLSLISRGTISAETAHGILDEQAALLEDWFAHAGFGPAENAQISAGLQDLLYLRRMLQQHPLTRLPD
jgi:hypothetical protein